MDIDSTQGNSGFQAFALNRQLFNAIEDAGYTKPTLIQTKAIPILLGGHDLLGIAPTGTGKTAAFLLPILMKIKFAQGEHPRCLIMAPTRELAMQIDSQITSFGKFTDVRHIAIYGGLGPKTQKEALAAGVDIIVATPGRFLDLYLNGDIFTRNIQILVLDEADKMMDMGFMPQIRRILEILPVKRQNMLFSATMPDKVLELSHEFLEFPLRVEAAPESTPVDTVTQELFVLPNMGTKLNLLLHFLQDNEKFHRVIVFTKTKQTAEEIGQFISKRIPGLVRIIHANKGQNSRINAMDAFRAQEVQVLVSTDVAARGIDIPAVSHVINFDVPVVYEDYVHRIGRTGRALNIGTAITFMVKSEEWHIDRIEKIIRMKIPRCDIPESVIILPTPFAEEQEFLRALDIQRKKEDPSYQGAFHEKKYQAAIDKSIRDKKKIKAGGKVTKPKSAYSGDPAKKRTTSSTRKSGSAGRRGSK